MVKNIVKYYVFLAFLNLSTTIINLVSFSIQHVMVLCHVSPNHKTQRFTPALYK